MPSPRLVPSLKNRWVVVGGGKCVVPGLDLLGWLGGGLGAVAYVLVSTRRVNADSVLFHGLNMVGAAMLCVGAFHSGALPNAYMNIAWVGFGAQSLAGASQRRRRTTRARLRAEQGVSHTPQPELNAPERIDLALDAA